MNQVLAAIVLVICIGMLVHMAIGERRRYRLDAMLRQWWEAIRRFAKRQRRRAPTRAEAERAAQDAIRRARERRNKMH
jgi:hypothetical protein